MTDISPAARLVISIIGLVAVLAVAGGVLLAWTGRASLAEVSGSFLGTLAVGAVTGLLGLLGYTRSPSADSRARSLPVTPSVLPGESREPAPQEG